MALLIEWLGSLEPDGWLTLAVVGIATTMMARERLGPDLVMFSALCVVTVAGIITPTQALDGFSQQAVATIAVLLVVAGAVSETGALRLISNTLLGRTKNATLVLLRIAFPTAVLSAFLNNTPIVAMFIPMIRTHAKRIGISPSKLLLPLSWAAMFGGTCTMIGTSANLVVAGMLDTYAVGEPLGVLEIGLVGLPTTIVGITYLSLFGQRMIPNRIDPLAAVQEDVRDYLVELAVASDSPLAGSTVEDAGLRSLDGLFLAEIRRSNGNVLTPVAPEDHIQAGDHLVFSGVASTVTDLISQFPGLVPVDHSVELQGGQLFEVVISHRSELLGMTVRDANFRRRFNAAILAVHRAGHRLKQKIGDIVLEPGDTVMLSAAPGFRDSWQDSPSFYVVSDMQTAPPNRYPKARMVLATAACTVLIPAFTGIPLLVAAMAAVVFLLLTDCIGVQGARNSVSWPVLVLIGSAFGVAAAMQESGVAAWLATGLLALTSSIGPYATLAAVYLLGVTVASFVSNAAGAALVFPVAIQAADMGGHNPVPFAIAIALAASAGFSTPIGCPPNLLVYGPGGYRYLDFARVGLPLNVIFLCLAVVLIPYWWPF